MVWGTTVGQSGTPFRIDHDEKFNQTTHLQYQPWKDGPWVGFNWRYDSGLVAGSVPFATDTTTPVDLTGLTADQQLQAGLFCGSQRPTLSTPPYDSAAVAVWFDSGEDSGAGNAE